MGYCRIWQRNHFSTEQANTDSLPGVPGLLLGFLPPGAPLGDLQMGQCCGLRLLPLPPVKVLHCRHQLLLGMLGSYLVGLLGESLEVALVDSGQQHAQFPWEIA
jgi:hypothetical protein